ncbi:MAG: divalent-cation tolerance protein CutA [Methanobacteriaceae archaeon]|jgi:periplasmic divalent cation tolerance protein|nr:divalent-cation tolerance protein CutA [Methanobacteriaceae archaeon]
MLVLIYITCQDKEEANNIGNTLVKNRLCACCNIIKQIDSIYWWENKIENDKESVLIAKTLESKIDDVISKVKETHSYDNPCILAIPTLKASEEYEDFINDEVD